MALSTLCIFSLISLSSFAKPISIREKLIGKDWKNTYDVDATQTVLDVSYSDNSYTSYTISVNGNKWLNSGMTGFRNGGNWAKLELNASHENTGNDPFGEYNEQIVFWTDSNNKDYSFGTLIRIYPNDPDVIVFGQIYPDGSKDSSSNDADAVISSFPSIVMDNKNLGFAHWAGGMAGDGVQYGKFDGSNGKPSGGRSNTGPMCIFDANMDNAVVISALTDHMGASDYTTEYNKMNSIEWGIIGDVSVIEKGFGIFFILSATRRGGGVNAAMRSWGDRQLQWYNKRRGNSHDRDFTLQYLGYSTDNGAYYYYETEPNTTYQQTMIDVKTYHDKLNLPTKWVLLDSWWYFKGENGGVKNWTAMPSIFPGGMKAVYEGTSWKIQAHNRYWALDNVYANNIPNQKEVGNYPFTWGEKSALPTTQSFWNYFFDINMDWGLIVYEQDWLSTSEGEVPLLANTTGFGREWLTQMGNAAADHDLSIQYCMDYPRHLMTSVGLASVTQARASGDYHPGNDQWKVGVTSIFASAIDIAPSKDSYWSMPNKQSGHYAPGTWEPYNRLQSAVITLSNGPVAFSDRIGYSDPNVIMQCCAQSGLVLRPDTSATMIDSYFRYRAGLANSSEMESGEIWTTTSMIGNMETYRYTYVFGVELDNNLDIYPSDISYHLANDTTDTWLYYETNTTSTFKTFNYKTPLTIQKGGKYDFQVYTLIPITGNNTWYLQGEIDKWVTVSQQRVKQIVTSSYGEVVVVIEGSINEKVNIGFVNANTLKQQIVSCTFDNTEQVVIKMPDATCQDY